MKEITGTGRIEDRASNLTGVYRFRKNPGKCGRRRQNSDGGASGGGASVVGAGGGGGEELALGEQGGMPTVDRYITLLIVWQ